MRRYAVLSPPGLRRGRRRTELLLLAVDLKLDPLAGEAQVVDDPLGR